MNNPWLITALGMGTVFISLIVMSFILRLFRPIFASERGKAGAAPAPAGAERKSPEPLREGELVAVITAAVAAASGRASDAFRIVGVAAAEGGLQSQAEAGFNTPIWGHIDRPGRAN